MHSNSPYVLCPWRLVDQLDPNCSIECTGLVFSPKLCTGNGTVCLLCTAVMDEPLWAKTTFGKHNPDEISEIDPNLIHCSSSSCITYTSSNVCTVYPAAIWKSRPTVTASTPS
ncbi:Uncharacterized protein APZ42_025302 [Daphnia magna]|uniref:Uncharacterized protein n=1 Tax=Daphnia magna TaxID=35525 RepID=A0A164T948_9CRUS|nr:Uncharacterized protein APZ42_025302 [Daphnia magna]